MTTPSTEQLPVAIQTILDGVSEVANLVEDLGPPHLGESLTDLHTRLLVTRAAMSRVSELAGDLTLLSGRVRRALIDRRGELEDAEATVVSTRRPVVIEDFSSAKEKNARIAAGTIESRVKVRHTEKVLADVEAAGYYVRDRHRELDRAVRDIDTRLRILGFEMSRHD